MDWIKEIVDGVIELYQTRNVYDLLDSLEITLIRKELHKGEKGRSFRDIFDNEFIFISNELSEQEEKIVIAHELGHLILHTDLSTNYYNNNNLLVKDRFEIEANKFATELLIPDDINLNEYETIHQLAYNLGVSEELVKLKYKDVMN